MNKPLTFPLGTLTVETIALASQGNAVLGIRDSGKTVTAEKLAEEMFAAGIPFVAFDPIGVWKYLRVPGTGRGIPVVVAGGEAGDLPLTPKSAPDIMRAAMKAGISLVFDLHDINLSKADWKRVVADSIRVLIYENGPHGLRHVFLEEAAEFVPQRVGPESGVVYAEIEKMARMGGNARLGYTLINQRAEEVNKSVLELCDNLFLHRQKGRHSITALSKWLNAGAVVDHKAITDSLSTLPTGECWAWMAQSETPVRIKIPMKDSFHPDRRILMDAMAVATKFKPVDASHFVASMKTVLEAAQPPAPPATPEAAKSARASTAPPGVDLDAIRREAKHAGHVEGYEKGHAEGYRVATIVATEAFEREITRLRDAAGKVNHNLAAVAPEYVARVERSHADQVEFDRQLDEHRPKVAAAFNDKAAIGLVQAAASVHPVALTWGQVCMIAGRKPSGGHFNTSRKRAIDAGWLTAQDDLVRLTDAGTAAVDHKPSDKPAIDVFAEALPEPAKKMFAVIRARRGITLEALASELQMKPHGGHWNTGISILRRNRLVLEADGKVYVAGWLTKEHRA